MKPRVSNQKYGEEFTFCNFQSEFGRQKEKKKYE